MNRRNEVPWFMDLTRHRGKLGISLGLSVPAAVLMLLVYGTDAWNLIFAIGTVAVAVGVIYLIARMGRSID